VILAQGIAEQLAACRIEAELLSHAVKLFLAISKALNGFWSMNSLLWVFKVIMA